MKYVYFNPNTLQVMQWLDTTAQSFEMPPDDFLFVVDEALWQAMNGCDCWVAGDALTSKPRPSLLHDWDARAADWVIDPVKQSVIDAEAEQSRRDAFQAELDEKMSWATGIAAALDYANKRKALPKDKAARLVTFNAYIDKLAALEYSATVVWPIEPV